MIDTLSIHQARKLALLSQGLPNSGYKALSGTLSAIQQLGYVQIDSISVVSRAHHHTLWSRIKNYQPEHINTLLKQGKIFEYWSHAAAYLPIEDYRFSLPNKTRIQESRHWFERDQKVEQEVLARIRAEGPLQAKDFQKPLNHEGGWWQWKPAKQALEQLFMAGELMCPYRQGFQKVYDLTERVLPEGIDQTLPTEQEMAQHLIEKALHSHGLIQLNEIGYLRQGLKNAIKEQVDALKDAEEIQEIRVGEQTYLTTVDLLTKLNKPLSRQRLCLLSPFDNLVIQRKRLKQLFDFDYRIECYVPAPKREFGYYVLPILWQGELVARMDAKANRQQGLFYVNNLVIEDKISQKLEAFAQALIPILQEYAAFNGCQTLHIQETQPANLKPILQNLNLKETGTRDT